MSNDEKEERQFQFELTRVQVDFEFWFGVAIGLVAIGYGLLTYFGNDPVGKILSGVLTVTALLLLVVAYRGKEERFKEIKEKYLDAR